MLLVDFGMVALGLFILVGAGDVLVKGAVNLALRLGIPALIVSLTVVAFGTSAPELLISVKAVLEDAPGIALGNVVGSNIANVLLVQADVPFPRIKETRHQGDQSALACTRGTEVRKVAGNADGGNTIVPHLPSPFVEREDRAFVNVERGRKEAASATSS